MSEVPLYTHVHAGLGLGREHELVLQLPRRPRRRELVDTCASEILSLREFEPDECPSAWYKTCSSSGGGLFLMKEVGCFLARYPCIHTFMLAFDFIRKAFQFKNSWQ